MADYKLRIACSPYNCDNARNIRVQIKCLSDNQDTDTAVFAYRKLDDNLFFDHVCSTVDMVEYPVIERNEDGQIVDDTTVNGESFKWCRCDIVDLLVRSLSIAEDFIAEVKSDVELLYHNMNVHNEIVGVETYIVE